MRRTPALLAAVAVIAAGAPASAAVRADSTLAKRLTKALRVPHVATATSAAIAIDLRTGEELFALNDTLPLEPASNEKLPLTYALLTNLDPQMRLETRVEAAGVQAGDTLQGDIVLVGGGDPMLTSRDLNRLARSVRAAGIRHVTGGVVGDESFFDSKRTCPGWKSSFYILESPPLSALVVNRSRYRNYVAPRPAKAAALLFRDALRAAGVIVDRGVAVRPGPVDALTLARSLSPPLLSIVRFMDLNSDNFTAEVLLKLLGAEVLGKGSSAAGAKVVMRTLKQAGISTAGVRIVDGSGLSRMDRLTVGTLAGILLAATTLPEVQRELVSALPVAGISGTLKNRMKAPALRGHVVAKTGTTSDASSLSGYVNSTIVFSVIQNGHPLSYWWAREAQDRFTKVLASQ